MDDFKPHIFIRDFNSFLKLHNQKIATCVTNKYQEYYKELRNQNVDKKRRNALSKANAESFICNLAKILSTDIISIVREHSVLFWLQFFRKVDTSCFRYNFQQPTTIYLIMRTIDCFVMKYGKKERSDVLNKDGELIPMYSPEHDFTSMGAIFYYCMYYNALTAVHRRLSKGCRVLLDENDFRVETPDEKEYLIKLIDTRMAKYGSPYHNIYSSEYSNLDPLGQYQKLLEKQKSLNNCPLLLYSEAVEPLQNYPYRYYPRIFFVEGALSTISFWNDMNIRINSFSPKELITLLSCLSWSCFAWDQGEEWRRQQTMNNLMTNAFSFKCSQTLLTAKEHYINGIAKCYSEMYVTYFHQQIQENIITGLVNRFYDQFSKTDTIDTFTRTNIPLFIECGDTVIVNWLDLMSDILYWTNDLNPAQSTDVGTNRGQLFQEEVRRIIRKSVSTGDISLWPYSTECLYLNGKAVAQIDIGFKVNNILFVIECKHKLSCFTNIETVETVDATNKAQKEWLKQVDKLAQIVCSGATLKDGTPLCGPDIQSVVPVVCTAIPYYISQKKDYYFIADDIPRVLTPLELLKVINMPIEKIKYKMTPIGPRE